MGWNILMMALAIMSIWNAKWIETTALSIYWQIPRDFFPYQVNQAIRNRFYFAAVMLAGAFIRILKGMI